MFRDKKAVQSPKSKQISWPRLLAGLAVGVGIFWLGWAIGARKIGPDSIFSHSINKNLPNDLDYQSVEQLYDALRNNYAGKLDYQKLLEGLKSGLAKASGDPYTEFLNAQSAEEFNTQLEGSFSGIGAELSKDRETDEIVVIAPIAGYPADKAGLRAKDIIASVNGQSTSGWTISETVNRIRGPEGSSVKLKVLRGDKELEFNINRARIVIPSVDSKVLKGNIGYIHISTFINNTADLTRQAALKLKSHGIHALIVDVRDNPGGLLDSSIDISSLWLNNKVVLYEKRGGQTVKTFRSDSDPLLDGIPTMVLINGGSASASEILAGALRDNGAATLLGEKSFGKGSVQQLVNLGEGTLLKVTIAKWYTPGDKNIDKEGIKPDKLVKLTDEDIKRSRDPQLDAAIKFLEAN